MLASVKFGPSFEDTGKGVTRLGSSELIIIYKYISYIGCINLNIKVNNSQYTIHILTYHIMAHSTMDTKTNRNPPTKARYCPQVVS